jgi:hypothetical protein
MSAEQSLPSAKKMQIDALRNGINDLVLRCTDKQIKFLQTIHDNAPWKGLANCPDDKLAETYELLRRTVIVNGDKP